MNQEHKTTGNTVTGIILLALGVILSPVAIGMLFSFPTIFGWFGILLSLSIFIFIFTGIKSIKNAKKEEVKTKQFIEKMKGGDKQNIETTPEANQPIILAQWIYQPEEWRQFMLTEIAELKIEGTILFLLFSCLGAPLIVFTRNEPSWLLAFAISGSLGAIIAGLQYYLKTSTLTKKGNINSSVIIGLDTILLNEKLITLRDEGKWLTKIKTVTDRVPMVMEFSYAWKTRKGVSNDEVRIPIPENKMKEVETIIEKIKSFHGLD